MWRAGVIAPLAGLFSFFGVSEATFIALSFLSSLGLLLVLFFLGEMLFGRGVGVLASILLAFNPLDVLYASILVPEPLLSFSLSLSVLLFLVAERRSPRICLFFLSGLFAGYTYLVKEQSAMYLVVFAISYIILRRKLRWQYGLVILGVAMSVIAEAWFFYVNTGDPFLRFRKLSLLSQLFTVATPFTIDYAMHHPSDIFWSARTLFRYVFWNPFGLLGISFWFVAAAVVYFAWMRRTDFMYIIAWLFAILGWLSLGSISFSTYIPPP